MSLSPGTRVGAYEILASLGAGGMGGLSRVGGAPTGAHAVCDREGCPEGDRVLSTGVWGSELFHLHGPDGKMGHAELQIGDSIKDELYGDRSVWIGSNTS